MQLVSNILSEIKEIIRRASVDALLNVCSFFFSFVLHRYNIETPTVNGYLLNLGLCMNPGI